MNKLLGKNQNQILEKYAKWFSENFNEETRSISIPFDEFKHIFSKKGVSIQDIDNHFTLFCSEMKLALSTRGMSLHFAMVFTVKEVLTFDEEKTPSEEVWQEIIVDSNQEKLFPTKNHKAPPSLYLLSDPMDLITYHTKSLSFFSNFDSHVFTKVAFSDEADILTTLNFIQKL